MASDHTEPSQPMGTLPHQAGRWPGPQGSLIAKMARTTSSYFQGQRMLPWVFLGSPKSLAIHRAHRAEGIQGIGNRQGKRVVKKLVGGQS